MSREDSKIEIVSCVSTRPTDGRKTRIRRKRAKYLNAVMTWISTTTEMWHHHDDEMTRRRLFTACGIGRSPAASVLLLLSLFLILTKWTWIKNNRFTSFAPSSSDSDRLIDEKSDHLHSNNVTAITLTQQQKKSFFECSNKIREKGGKDGSFCVSFSPREFFQRGLGKPFLDDYERAQLLCLRFGLVKNPR